MRTRRLVRRVEARTTSRRRPPAPRSGSSPPAPARRCRTCRSRPCRRCARRRPPARARSARPRRSGSAGASSRTRTRSPTRSPSGLAPRGPTGARPASAASSARRPATPPGAPRRRRLAEEVERPALVGDHRVEAVQQPPRLLERVDEHGRRLGARCHVRQPDDEVGLVRQRTGGPGARGESRERRDESGEEPHLHLRRPVTRELRDAGVVDPLARDLLAVGQPHRDAHG